MNVLLMLQTSSESVAVLSADHVLHFTSADIKLEMLPSNVSSIQISMSRSAYAVFAFSH